MAEKVGTGVPGLDELIDGGLETGTITLVTGASGTGKTLLGLHFSHQGVENDEPVLYVTLEEDEEGIRKDMASLGMGTPEEKRMEILHQQHAPFKALLRNVREHAETIGAKRIIIDSILPLMNGQPGPDPTARIDELTRLLKELGTTSLLLSQTGLHPDTTGIERLVDGIILLRCEDMGFGPLRTLQIKKMRRAPHTDKTHPLKIEKTGLRVIEE